MAAAGPVHSLTTEEPVALPELTATVLREPQPCAKNGSELRETLRRSLEQKALARLEARAEKERPEQAPEHLEPGGFPLRRGAASTVEIVWQGVPAQALARPEPTLLSLRWELTLREKESAPLKAEYQFLAERAPRQAEPAAPELAMENVVRP